MPTAFWVFFLAVVASSGCGGGVENTDGERLEEEAPLSEEAPPPPERPGAAAPVDTVVGGLGLAARATPGARFPNGATVLELHRVPCRVGHLDACWTTLEATRRGRAPDAAPDWQEDRVTELAGGIVRTCWGALAAPTLRPGASFIEDFQYRSAYVLGDSLPDGAYRLRAVVELQKPPVTGLRLDAGTLELTRPPP